MFWLLRCQLTSGLMTGAIVRHAARTNHLSFRKRRVWGNIFLRTSENRDKEEIIVL
jgi:hypothetical protein